MRSGFAALNEPRTERRAVLARTLSQVLGTGRLKGPAAEDDSGSVGRRQLCGRNRVDAVPQAAAVGARPAGRSHRAEALTETSEAGRTRAWPRPMVLASGRPRRARFSPGQADDHHAHGQAGDPAAQPAQPAPAAPTLGVVKTSIHGDKINAAELDGPAASHRPEQPRSAPWRRRTHPQPARPPPPTEQTPARTAVSANTTATIPNPPAAQDGRQHGSAEAVAVQPVTAKDGTAKDSTGCRDRHPGPRRTPTPDRRLVLRPQPTDPLACFVRPVCKKSPANAPPTGDGRQRAGLAATAAARAAARNPCRQSKQPRVWS